MELKNGEVYELRGSNDVNDENKGIFIINDGDEVRLEWDEFESVTFD